MNTFLTSYNKNKAGGVSSRTAIQQQEVIAESRADELDSGDDFEKSLNLDLQTKEGFKDLIRF